VYLKGSKEDYERWAELVGDEEWAWESVKESFREIEEYDASGTSAYKHLADPDLGAHGTKGQLKVGMPPVLERGVAPRMEAMIAGGEKVNLDVNSGDPVGVSVFPFSYAKEGRSTSAGAHLADKPANLEIWTEAVANMFVWEGKRVVGVVLADGREGMY
jgi:choline dehydrogenase-like flavoprotein